MVAYFLGHPVYAEYVQYKVSAANKRLFCGHTNKNIPSKTVCPFWMTIRAWCIINVDLWLHTLHLHTPLLNHNCFVWLAKTTLDSICVFCITD